MTNPAVFVSYRRSDTRWFAAMLLTRIKQHLPCLDVFLDVASIGLGLSFAQVLAQTLDRSTILLALIGNSWLTVQDEAGRRRIDNHDDWVRLEVARALERNIEVIPILVDGEMMPKRDFLTPPIAGLAERQSCEVKFEDHDTGILKILQHLSKSCNVAFAESPSPTLGPTVSNTASATAVLDSFDDALIDNETLTVLAEHQLDVGRFTLARAMFEIVAERHSQRMREHPVIDGVFTTGYPDVTALHSWYQVGKATMLAGDSAGAESLFAFVLDGVERERDPSYPLYIRTQIALARTYLERGMIEDARRALPQDRGLILAFRDQSATAVDAWIAHLDCREPSRDRLLLQLEKEMTMYPPSIELARSVCRLRETMHSPSVSPTMIWKPDRL